MATVRISSAAYAQILAVLAKLNAALLGSDAAALNSVGWNLEKAVQKKRDLEQELKTIERELAAINAYEKAKGGTSARAPKRGKGKQPAQRRAPRGEKRSAVIEVIIQHPDGLSRGEILNLVGVKGDKSGEQSVSNALSALTKQNQVGKRDGKYVPA